MRFTTATLLAAGTALGMPWSTTLNEPSRVVAEAGAIHSIDVNNDGFFPPDLEAEAGDILEFHFEPGTHSVIQASFDSPCKFANGGFASGIMVTQTNEEENRLILRVAVSNDEPIWFYNGSLDRCHKHGHVGVVNAPNSLENDQYYGGFRRAALKRTYTENIATMTGGVFIESCRQA
ncbi:Extracellular serine-rich protein [Ceratocystis lukuohia]|uniref:Extracellular serine-rich protein n=1 Tax=Ceratocystis lukuohia TaxID=2019550 RepID=A0ABR4MHE2_9PEZI